MTNTHAEPGTVLAVGTDDKKKSHIAATLDAFETAVLKHGGATPDITLVWTLADGWGVKFGLMEVPEQFMILTPQAAQLCARILRRGPGRATTLSRIVSMKLIEASRDAKRKNRLRELPDVVLAAMPPRGSA